MFFLNTSESSERKCYIFTEVSSHGQPKIKQFVVQNKILENYTLFLSYDIHTNIYHNWEIKCLFRIQLKVQRECVLPFTEGFFRGQPKM